MNTIRVDADDERRELAISALGLPAAANALEQRPDLTAHLLEADVQVMLTKLRARRRALLDLERSYRTRLREVARVPPLFDA